MKNNTWFKLLSCYLTKIKHGQINICFKSETASFGDQNAVIKATIIIHNKKVFKQILLGGSVSLAEAYMSGDWDCDHLNDLFLIFLKNYRSLNQLDGFISLMANTLNKIKNLKTKNTIKQSQKNIQAHYDLSNDFYQLFLDDTMMYSAAYFSDSNMSLVNASKAKLERICQKIQLTEDDHVLEIGSGWGGFAFYAVKKYGCKVTTTTISQAQYNYVKDKIKQHQLEEKIELLFKDYRALSGRYDKLVSVEMIEAVGTKYVPTYFKQCCHLIKNNGLFLLQTITISDQHFTQYEKDVDFIKKHIFPGGCLPSLQFILNTMTQYTSLQVHDVFSLGRDYAKTLQQWRLNFEQKLDAVRNLGFNDNFIRMWRYYLQYCEAGFLQGHINDFQILFKKAEHF